MAIQPLLFEMYHDQEHLAPGNCTNEKNQTDAQCLLSQVTCGPLTMDTVQHCDESACTDQSNEGGKITLRYASHMLAVVKFLQDFSASLSELGVLLEDDAVMPHDFMNRLRELLQTVPPGWDILKLGWWNQKWSVCGSENNTLASPDPDVVFKAVDRQTCLGTHAMLFNRSRAEWLMNYTLSTGIASADITFSKGAFLGSISMYAVTKPLVNISVAERESGFEDVEANLISLVFILCVLVAYCLSAKSV